MTLDRRTVLWLCAAAPLLLAAAGRRWNRAAAQERTAREIEVAITGGTVADADTVVRVTEGDTVALRWTSDRRLDLHLHGYDVEVTVAPGAPATMTVDAYAAGRYPVEMHGGPRSHETLLYFEVYPR